jgi:hypothetical protein
MGTVRSRAACVLLARPNERVQSRERVVDVQMMLRSAFTEPYFESTVYCGRPRVETPRFLSCSARGAKLSLSEPSLPCC